MRISKLMIGAVVVALAVGVTGIASADTVKQVVNGKILPKKRPAAKFTKAKIDVLTDGQPGNSANIPPAANRAQVSFDKHIKFTTSAAAKCNSADIAGDSTATARNTCTSALVGTGTAVLYLGAAGTPKTGPGTVPVTVSAFNATIGGGPGLLLHSDPGASPVTLEGKLTNTIHGGKYKKMLDVTVPPTGGSLGEFHVIVGKVKNPTLGSATTVPGPYV
jgi:hypothetical protein